MKVGDALIRDVQVGVLLVVVLVDGDDHIADSLVTDVLVVDGLIRH